MVRVNQVKIKADHTEEQLKKKAAELLRISAEDIREMKIVRRSVDARRKPEIFYSYSLDIKAGNEDRILHRFRGRENQVSRVRTTGYTFPRCGQKRRDGATVIAGMGPAGLFCGYFLALHGYCPILLERGKCVEERQRDVEEFWRTGCLNEESNVQFGEGGAGTFSDGKLNTLVKDRDGRNGVVLETLARFGAGESICYEAKPHIGTDVLRKVVRNMRNEIVRLGGQVRFQSLVTDLEIQGGRVTGVVINGGERLACGQLVLAVGHSARDTFAMLQERRVPMEAKAFAVGLRVEHPQSMINESQYGMADPGRLGAASYKVTAKAKNGRGVYSFCMCPGGYVVNASSEKGRTAVNGMSYSGRDGVNANSAVIVTVTPEDYGAGHPLAGVEFQRRLEEKAFRLGQGKIPAQRYGEYREKVLQRAEAAGETDGKEQAAVAEGAGQRTCVPVTAGRELEAAGPSRDEDSGPGTTGRSREAAGPSRDEDGEPETAGRSREAAGPPRDEDGGLQPQCRGEYTWTDLSGLLPQSCAAAFVDGMESFGRQIRGFNRPDAILLGVESRTSSPVRICRDETLQAQIRGLYPCGEGAGYAGGITSAAMDGLRVAERIAGEYAP